MGERRKNHLQTISLDQVMDAVPAGCFQVDRNGKIVRWNHEAARMTGYSPEEMIGKEYSFLENLSLTGTCAPGKETFGTARGIPWSLRNRDGSRLTLQSNVEPLRDDQGGVIGAVVFFTDVSSQVRLENRFRRQTEEPGRKAEERTAEFEAERTHLRTTLDAMGDLAYITSVDCRVEFMNRAMLETVGDYRGRHCYEIFGQREVCPWCPLPEVLSGKTVRQERFVAKCERTYDVIHTPLPVQDGTFLKLSVFRDVTERNEAEKALQQAYRELDAFVHTVSHDLRTPLTPVIGYAALLQDQYRDLLDPRAMEMLKDIEGQGQRMLRLMEDLLTLSRVGRLDPPPAPVAPAPIVEQVLADLLADENEEIRIDVGELAPVAVPETLLGEVFANLIGNAVRYGGGKTVEIGSRRVKERIRFFVRDHGPGIPPSEREEIFELFRRGSTSSGTRGTGIGLATVRKIAERYGGKAWVEETQGGGSTFWVEFAAPGADTGTL